jgi:hypothetical protein
MAVVLLPTSNSLRGYWFCDEDHHPATFSWTQSIARSDAARSSLPATCSMVDIPARTAHASSRYISQRHRRIERREQIGNPAMQSPRKLLKAWHRQSDSAVLIMPDCSFADAERGSEIGLRHAPMLADCSEPLADAGLDAHSPQSKPPFRRLVQSPQRLAFRRSQTARSWPSPAGPSG